MIYKLKMSITGIDYKSSGDTVLECLDGLGLDWPQIKAKGICTLSTKGKKYEHLFALPMLKRIFANKMTRLLWAKRLTILIESK